MKQGAPGWARPVFMMGFWFEKAICKFVIFFSKILCFKRVNKIIKGNHLDF